MMLGVKSPPIMPCQHRLCGCLSWSPRWFCDARLAETTCPSKHGIVQYCAVQDMPWSMRPQTCCRWRRATTRLIAGLHLRVAPQPIADRWGRLDHRPPFFFLALFRVIRTLQGPFEGGWPLWSMAASTAVVVNGGGGGGSGGDEGAHEDGTISNDNGKRSLFCVNAWGAWEAYSYSCRTPCGTCLGSHPNDPYFGKLFRKQRHLRRVRRLYIIQQRGQLQHHRQHAARGRAVRYGVLQHGPEDQDRPSAG